MGIAKIALQSSKSINQLLSILFISLQKFRNLPSRIKLNKNDNVRNISPKSARITPKLAGSVGRYKSSVSLEKDERSFNSKPHTLSKLFSIERSPGNLCLSRLSHSLLVSVSQGWELARRLLFLHITGQLNH